MHDLPDGAAAALALNFVGFQLTVRAHLDSIVLKQALEYILAPRTTESQE